MERRFRGADVIKDVRHGAGVSQDGGEDGPAVAPTAVLGSFMLAPQSEPIVGGPPPPPAADMPRTSSARLLSPVQVDVAEFRRWALGPDDTRQPGRGIRTHLLPSAIAEA
jgi:hypothetical protein